MNLLKLRFLAACFPLFLGSINAQWQPLPGPTGGAVRSWTSAPDGQLWAGGSAGVFTSKDNGQTWHLLPKTANLGVLPIQLDWDGGNLYFVGQSFGTNQQAVFKSSDNGATWQNIRSGVWGMTNTMSVFDARNDTILVNASPGQSSLDGGKTWKSTLWGGNSNVIGTDHGWFNSFFSAAYRWSTDLSWDVVYSDSDQAFHPRRILEVGDFLFLFFSQDNRFRFKKKADTGWTDGILPIFYNEDEVSVSLRNDTIFVHGKSEIAFSTDGLATFQSWQTNLTGQVRATFFQPDGSVVACSSNGIFRATSVGTDFLPTLGFKSKNALCTYPFENEKWLLGATDGLFFSKNNGSNWEKKLGQFQNGSEPIRWIKKSGETIFAGNDTRLFFSPDAGENWLERALPPIQTPAINDFSAFGQRLFFGNFDGIWASEDQGESWQPLDVSGIGKNILARVFAENDSLLAVGGQWAELFLSRDTGATWQNFSAGLGGIPYIMFEVGIGSEQLFAVSGYRLMRSPLAGPNWTEVSLPIPIVSADGAIPRAFHFSGGEMKAGIPNVGIFRSTDGGASWQPTMPTLLYGQTNSLFFTDSTTALATNGGVWYSGSFGEKQIGGRVFVDLNQNGAFDIGEQPLKGQLVELSGHQNFAITDTTGRYVFDWRGVPDSLRLRLFSNLPGGQLMELFADSSGLDFNFPIQPIGAQTDLALDLEAAQLPRPGFPFNVFLTCRNDGFLPTTARLSFAKTLGTDWGGFSETPSFLNADTAKWLLPTIQPGEFIQIRTTLKLDAGVPLNSVLLLGANLVTEAVLDADGSNNLRQLALKVVGSFDPNDKSVSPAGSILPAESAAGKRLEYRIRFQNTGTFPAEFVRITDTISPNLDLSTIQMVAASHPMTWSIAGRTVEFFFPNIQLPDSSSNEPDSHGFVKFSLEMRRDLKENDAIKNVANIFFDFNTPVRTNEVETILKTPIIRVFEQQKNWTFGAAPNPLGSSDVLNIEIENDFLGVFKIEIWTLDGRLFSVFEKEKTARRQVFEIEKLPAQGPFIVRVSDEKTTAARLVVKF
jgi:uncharacterized repeat protein (TIGR01451 family)